MAAPTKKELEKRRLIKKTIASMEKQIQKLEEKKRAYLEAGKEAKQRGLTAQYDLAVAGLRTTIAQQRRVYEMKLNFEITSQMKDMAEMTAEFLGGMSALSKDMLKLTKVKDFGKVQRQFTDAMAGVELQTEQMESFMDETEAIFSTSMPSSPTDEREIDSLFSNVAGAESDMESEIDKELEALKRKMAE